MVLGKMEQSNTSAVLGDRLMLKWFRRIESGVNPDLEVTRFLTDRGFAHVPAVAGFSAYRPDSGEPMATALLQEFIPNEGDVWALTLDRLDDFVDRAAAAEEPAPLADPSTRSLVARAAEEVPDVAHRMIDSYLDTAWLLGTRTAELHRALASDPPDPEFGQVPFAAFDQRSLYQSLRNSASQTLLVLKRAIAGLPEAARDDARSVVAAEAEIEGRYRRVLEGRLTAMKIRVHGDLHLGQVLWTGKDVVLTDFEGEPARPLSERRRRRACIVDVAGMIRSFHYAAYGLLADPVAAGSAARHQDLAALQPWMNYWYVWTAATFLRGYREAARDATFLPRSDDEFVRLLDAFLLEKAIYEVGYELNNRPDWIRIPLRGIRELLAT